MGATKENKIIGIGSIVTIFDLDLEEKQVYKIVSTKTGKQEELLFDCALGEALLEKTIGEKVIVKAKEEYQIEILSVDNSNVETSYNIFFCFQGNQYQPESDGGYIFVLAGKGIASWERLYDVKKGDIIFHCDEQKIKSISIAKGKCFIAERPAVHFLANNYPDKKGLMVKTKYQLLNQPIITSCYKKEIIAFQGNTDGKGYPFNVNGTGNQGYLFNLNKSLAKFFMGEIIKNKENSFMGEKDYVKDLLK